MSSARGTQILLATSISAVAAAVIGAIAVMDSPTVQRQRKMDARRVEDLAGIKRSIDAYWLRRSALAPGRLELPPDLVALGKEPGVQFAAGDPETGTPYAYEVTGRETYRLCAVFAL